ncbi:isoprenylcysteine carboxylmethyltransferase family protein [Rhodoblastus sp. 17X3]|uniref:methyltransferase family protein n=1 Tax=Rhodoblastus sp. 17X3 TaxID=3047026 RepID=UPI0024B6AF18|nr:isoprenylcysteine carboxylmethyltransferase family protein [Rhodoblastus sp. 17X3]MDI9848843.1 isoprenylcysteine carboxylmethyltransferase family protein [Rhodoblastus sp. 17X3]
MTDSLPQKLRRALTDDRLLRIPLVLAFAAMALSNAKRLYGLLSGALDPGVSSKTLAVAATCSNLLFMALLVWLTVVRSMPIKSADGLAPRLYAFWGTFSVMLVGALPYADLADAARVFSISLVTIGALLSVMTVSWLGRSFSIVPQSRQLVTGGPYSIVRHPLYVCEAIAIIGVMLDHLSWAAVVIVAGQWYCQLQRMKYEERLLRETFPEYEAYAIRTPALIPAIWSNRTSWAKP